MSDSIGDAINAFLDPCGLWNCHSLFLRPEGGTGCVGQGTNCGIYATLNFSYPRRRQISGDYNRYGEFTRYLLSNGYLVIVGCVIDGENKMFSDKDNAEYILL